MDELPIGPINELLLKVAGRCNLNCSYCYVYNKADTTWRSRPALMSGEVFRAAMMRLRTHCLFFGQTMAALTFHGGEPTLVGPSVFNSWCAEARAIVGEVADVQIRLQTNATLLDSHWAEVLARNGVRVGISMDGPRDVNDTGRVDHAGRGSYDKVLAGIRILENEGVSFGILCVVPLGYPEPLSIHRHFVGMGISSLSYLFPDFTHDTISDIRAQYGATPVADFLIPVFDDWWFNGTIGLILRPFWNMARAILGGNAASDSLQNPPLRLLAVETDGGISGLDVLRVCADGLADTGLNVMRNDFAEICHAHPLHARMVFDSLPLADQCLRCPERLSCGGGYLPHRYSSQTGFANPSVWCEDLLRLFAHMRTRMGISQEGTGIRRARLKAIEKADVDVT